MSATVAPEPSERVTDPPELVTLHPPFRGYELVFKTGPLYISWRVLGAGNRGSGGGSNSLIFFKHDPNLLPPEERDANLTLGGIELNKSFIVSLQPEKKLLTVVYTEGRTFTLKAETMEDLVDWKDAFDRALAVAPNASESLLV